MLRVHLEKGRVEVRPCPRPRPPAGFALIRLRVGGICNTDLELLRGYYNFRGTPGHEFVGEVVTAQQSELVGKRVVGEINLSCGRCQWCRRGLGRHCPHRKVLGIAGHPGAFSEYFTLPEANLHVLPENIPDEEAVFAEPLAAACEILEQVAFPPGSEVAVLGDGKLGLLVAQVLHLHGMKVTLFGRHAHKLAIAEQAGIGIKLASRPPQDRYEWVIEATGSAEGLRQALQTVQPRGTVIVKSTLHKAVPLDTAAFVVNEITLIGSRCGRFEVALNLLAQGRLRLREMITAEYPLADAPRAFRAAAGKQALKILLRAAAS